MGILITTIILGLIGLTLVSLGRIKYKDDVGREAQTFHLKWIGLPVIALAAFIFLLGSIAVVGAGNAAVPVTFGSVGQSTGPGVHFKAPWTTFHSVSTRTQEYTMSKAAGEGAKAGDDAINVLGGDAGTADIDATLLYHVTQSEAGSVFKHLGSDFVNKVIRPSSRTCIRDAFAGTDIVNAVTNEREAVVATIRTCIESKLTRRGLTLEDFQMRGISLSPTLQAAVDAKVAAQQQSQQKVFELQKAEADARITTVEAKAKADSQQILACGGTHGTGRDSLGRRVDTIVPNSIGNCNQAQLTPAFLELQKIQALQNMVNAPNHTTLVIPENFNGLLNLPGNGG